MRCKIEQRGGARLSGDGAMKCRVCGSDAVYPGMCKDHFSSHIEDRFARNVEEHNLFSSDDVLVVAVSGGKDSLTTLHLTNKLFSNEVHALCIDEGISGYRHRTIRHAKRFCKEWNVPLHIHSFRHEFGFDLDDFHEPNPCSVCGVLRRQLLNRFGRQLGDVLITGHNLDDEAQSIAMDIIQGDLARLDRMGWKAGVGEHPLFVPRVKPMRNISEKEATTYWFANFSDICMAGCPYAQSALRNVVRSSLNDFEKSNPGSKKRLVEWADSVKPGAKESVEPGAKESIKPGAKDINGEMTGISGCRLSGISGCRLCNEPTGSEVCEACRILKRYAERRGKG